jgi:hypothetical protein
VLRMRERVLFASFVDLSTFQEKMLINNETRSSVKLNEHKKVDIYEKMIN